MTRRGDTRGPSCASAGGASVRFGAGVAAPGFGAARSTGSHAGLPLRRWREARGSCRGEGGAMNRAPGFAFCHDGAAPNDRVLRRVHNPVGARFIAPVPAPTPSPAVRTGIVGADLRVRPPSPPPRSSPRGTETGRGGPAWPPVPAPAPPPARAPATRCGTRVPAAAQAPRRFPPQNYAGRTIECAACTEIPQYRVFAMHQPPGIRVVAKGASTARNV